MFNATLEQRTQAVKSSRTPRSTSEKVITYKMGTIEASPPGGLEPRRSARASVGTRRSARASGRCRRDPRVPRRAAGCRSDRPSARESPAHRSRGADASVPAPPAQPGRTVRRPPPAPPRRPAGRPPGRRCRARGRWPRPARAGSASARCRPPPRRRRRPAPRPSTVRCRARPAGVHRPAGGPRPGAWRQRRDRPPPGGRRPAHTRAPPRGSPRRR